MKKFYLCIVATIATSLHVIAMENEQDNSINLPQTNEQVLLDHTTWKKHAQYFNISILGQTLIDKTFDKKNKGFIGSSLSWGKTFYLHKKPISNIMKIGLDWTWLDMNLALLSQKEYNKSNGTHNDYVNIQGEVGMQIGPSITIKPKNNFKMSAYVRTSPSISIINLDRNKYFGYVTFLNTGCSFAWNKISLGVEWRYGSSANYSYSESEGDDGYYTDKNQPDKHEFISNTLRLFLGFRF